MNEVPTCIDPFDIESRLDLLQDSIEAMEKAMVKKKRDCFFVFREEVELRLAEMRNDANQDHSILTGQIKTLRAQMEELGKLIAETALGLSTLRNQFEFLHKRKWYEFAGRNELDSNL